MTPIIGSHRALFRPSVWSNLFFVAPALLALHFGNYTFFSLLVIVIIASVFYHLFSERDSGGLLGFDRIAAGLAILYNAGLIAFGGFTFPYFQSVIILVGVALFFFKKQHEHWHKSSELEPYWIMFTFEKKQSGENNSIWNKYEIYHALWHLATAIVALLSILTFYF